MKLPSFMRYLFKLYPNQITEIVVIMSKNNLDYTMRSCYELIRQVEELPYLEPGEFVRLAKIVVSVLSIDDKYQRIRLESLLGFPQIIIDDVNDRHKFPVFGYNKLPNQSQKWLDFRTVFNKNINNQPLLHKLYSFHNNSRTVAEVFLILLESSITNHSLLKYLRYIPREEPGNGTEE
jgi:hypothetical protein